MATQKSFIFVKKACDRQHSIIILLIAGIMYINFNHIYLKQDDDQLEQDNQKQHNKTYNPKYLFE